MAPKKSSIVLNVEQFIHDVEERPAIWNRNYHCNKAFLEQMWEELSASHKLPKVVLKAKWKGLRDNFRVEYKRIPRADNGDFLLDPATFESKWIHYYALLFLTEHMRHRMPKNEQDASSFYYPQQSQECEKTIVEPDLTNGLIRIPDSDEEFDEDDVEDEDEDVDEDNDDDLETAPHKVIAASLAASASTASLETPPAAHTQPPLSSSIKIEESSTTRSLLRPLKDLQKQSAEKQAAEDLSKKSATATTSNTTTTTPAATSTTTAAAAAAAAALAASISGSSVNSLAAAFNSSTSQAHKKRSVSPPPLYNKAHHVATTPLTAAALSKEREDYQPHQLHNGNSSLHGSLEHLNFTKHSYANGLIPALKLKRPRLSEDSNFNGSSTMDNTSSLVPEDDDYHYLLSLHPYMKQLNAAQKLRIRTKIQKLIFKELYKEDLEETK